MTPKLKFSEGEKVLCFHGPLIYEAKALKHQITKDKQIRYYIHYAGWNKNWDEWVPENRVLKYNEANCQRQMDVFKQHSSVSNRKKGSLKGKKGSDIGGNANTSKDGGISSGGSESRASTPSKEETKGVSSNANLVAPSSNRSVRSVKPKEKNSDDGSKDDEGISSPVVKKKRGSSISNVSDKSSSSNNNNNNATTTTASTATTNSTTTTTTSTLSATTATTITSATTTSTNTTAATTTTTAAATPLTTSAATGASAVNRQEIGIENEETFLSRVEVKIKIPDELKQCLADDWDAITRQHKLLDIPAKITVQDIVNQYIACKKASKTTNASKEVAIHDVLNGIIEYFNVMLGSQLLYKFERPQYAEILVQHADTPLSKLYGAFHLLRLFVKLGSMLGFSALDEKAMQTLLVHLNDFLKFLVKNSATFFSMGSFVNASPEYHRNLHQ